LNQGNFIMKRIFLSLTVGIAFLAACTPVKFDRPQPEGVEKLMAFPDDFEGFYVDEGGDTLQVTSGGFEYGFGSSDSTCMIRSLSSGNMVLKKFKGNYVLSLNEDELWDVLLIRPATDGFDLCTIDVSNKDSIKVEQLREITKVKTVRNSDDEVEYYLISPDKSAFRKILKAGLFVEGEHFQRVR